MILNWKEINLVLEELDLEGSLIQQVYQPEHQIILFELYKSGNQSTLLFSLSPSSCRIHTTKRKYSNPKKPQRFVSFLRAHIRGSRICGAYQLEDNRIIKIKVKKGDKFLIIWARLWGGAANMIVTDEQGKVLDACYRRPGRDEISRGHYNPEQENNRKKEDPYKSREYTVRDLPGTGTFNEKVEAYFHEKEDINHKQKLIQSLTLILKEKENFFSTALEKTEKQKDDYINSQRYKELGDLLMSSLHDLKKGDRWLSVKDFYNNNKKIEIELNPNLSPRENAEIYYEKYKNAKSGLTRLEKNEQYYRRSLKEIKNRQRLLHTSTDIATLITLKKAYQRKNTQKTVARIPGLQFRSKDFLIMIGRTALENDLLLRKYVHGNDYWFHSRDYPGSYVFVKVVREKSVPLQVMLDAGNLALFYSKGKESGQGDVFYTQVKYLRRVKNGKKGKVIPTQEKNLYIVLDLKRIENLKNSSGDLLNSGT
ncbi:MAG: NFACT family protein [Spirochaetales bacterium]|nr:NFACT family protein [Spirochaetales bacterium]